MQISKDCKMTPIGQAIADTIQRLHRTRHELSNQSEQLELDLNEWQPVEEQLSFPEEVLCPMM